jgi:hypothetical protein
VLYVLVHKELKVQLDQLVLKVKKDLKVGKAIEVIKATKVIKATLE